MTRGAVATPHHLATEAGCQVLRDGGNAIDAAVAANAVLCVVYPHNTAIGGDLSALVWPAGAAAPIGLEGLGRAPEAASIEALRALGHEEMPQRGPLPITVPGTLRAWGRLLERYGTVGFGVALEAAIAVAQDGFLVTRNLAQAFRQFAPLLMADRESSRVLPPLQEGMKLRQPDLASSLKVLARGGFGAFYFGELGAAIVEAVRARGGLLSQEDLARHRGDFVEPVRSSYRGATLYVMPPPAQGVVGLAFLRRMEAWSPAQLVPGQAFVRRFAELRDVCYSLRAEHLTDPQRRPVPLEPFLDPDLHGDTIHLCTADEHGNLVALTQSLAYEFGSGIVADRTGILLQNRGAYFSLDPEAANRLEPGKRTMHTLMPVMASGPGGWRLAEGQRAGEGQPQIQVQVLSAMLDAGLDPQDAVARPRCRVAPGGRPIWVEADFPDAGEMARSGAGRPVELVPPLDNRMGHAQAIAVDGGGWRPAADPRSDGSAVVV